MRCFLKRIGRRAGKVASVVASEIGPTLPPAISTMSWVARSMALVCKVASTPRSKRCDEASHPARPQAMIGETAARYSAAGPPAHAELTGALGIKPCLV